jgi:membrane protein YdbS with pleckstrin-like domain
MGYPSKLLNPGEVVAVDVRPHWKYLSGPAFVLMVVIAGSIVALVESVPQWAELALAALIVVCALWLVGRYLRWTTTSFAVTSERLVLREGVLRRTGREIRLDSLTDISYSQTLLDRMLGCGDILLESPGRDSQEVFPDLPHPITIQNEIYRLINQRQSTGWRGGMPPPGGAGPGGTGPGGTGGAVAAPAGLSAAPDAADGTAAAGGEDQSVAAQLSQLDELRRRGVISRKEFAAKKAELLSRM